MRLLIRTCAVKTYDFGKAGRADTPLERRTDVRDCQRREQNCTYNIVEQVTLFTQLCDHHTLHVRRRVGKTDAKLEDGRRSAMRSDWGVMTYKSDYIGMIELGQEL